MRLLRKSIKQRKPFESLEQEVFLEVLRTGTAMIQDLVDVLKRFDLTQPQYNVLRILRGAGPGGLPSGEVGERMVVSREPDVTGCSCGWRSAGGYGVSGKRRTGAS